MLRGAGFLVAALMLAGCGGNVQTEVRTVGGDHCSQVAAQRAADAAVNGYDRDMQRHIYDDTYRDCIRQRQSQLP